ncbi:AAA family ATPase, partial [bacterium]|nr:AAA family ATPase [bacterium]
KTAKIYLQIGDIKSSLQPRYHQKWQVAFYAFLLNRLIADDPRLSRFKVAGSGFLLTPASENDSANVSQQHNFDLQPYLDTFPAILKSFRSSLEKFPANFPANSSETGLWQLKQPCQSCSYFEFCYEQVLAEEELQLIPHLSLGDLQKLRSLGLRSIKQIAGTESEIEAFLSASPSFSSRQKDRLEEALQALSLNQIRLIKEQTDRFPANISTLFVVHLINDPVSRLAQGLGLTIKNRGVKEETRIWLASTSAERKQIWREFSLHLQKLWQDAVQNGRGPHIFLYESRIRQELSAWADVMNDQPMLALFLLGSDSLNCHYTDLSQVLTNHFHLPLPGTVTFFALNRILGLMDKNAFDTPATLIHGDSRPEIINAKLRNNISDPGQEMKLHLAISCQFVMKLSQWLEKNLESDWHKENWQLVPQNSPGWASVCRQFIEAEKLHQEKDLKALAELPLAERVARFRALGPLNFSGTTLDDEGRFLFLFALIEKEAGMAKFRKGDFLKLVPIGATELQSGLPVVMAHYDVRKGQVALYFRQRRNLSFSQALSYSLEEDGQDFHSDKLLGVVQTCFSDRDHHAVVNLLAGKLNGKQPNSQQMWLSNWISSEAAPASLNQSQQEALALPFQYNLSLISGPPGTGKTNLLGWILIALIRQAQSRGTGLQIAVSALTHQAIDQVLRKVVSIVNNYNLTDLPVRCIKWGRWEGEKFDPENHTKQVETLNDAQDLFNSPYQIVGATGYGLHDLMAKRSNLSSAGKHNPRNSSEKPFDWVIFDEASQMLIPQALLSLIYGKGNFLFLGDVKQLPPIIRSSIFKEDQTATASKNIATTSEIDAAIRNSILELLLRHYPDRNRELNVTYRMNQNICRFPSQTWYHGRLLPAAENVHAQLSLAKKLGNNLLDQIIDPQNPVVLVGINHLNCSQESQHEAILITRLSLRLLDNYAIKPEQLAIISPHRTQNNAIASSLRELLGAKVNELPVIDTVERLQGAERDVIIFGFTCSDPDLVLSEFLNNPNRFNVAITRARKKLIVIGSKIFFEAIAQTEKQLQANACFKNFFEYCCKNDLYFELDTENQTDCY